MTAMYSRVELSGRMARIIYSGQRARIERVFHQTDEIAKRHAHQALDTMGERTVAALQSISPVGQNNPGTQRAGGHTPARAAGTLKASWRHRTMDVGDDVLMEVYSTDPVSEYVDKGTGIYQVGGSGKMIRGNPWLVIPARDLKIGGNVIRGTKGKKRMDVRFLKSSKGTKPMHLVRRAQMMVRPTLGPTLRNHARQVKAELVARLRVF
jgi:hypothetical protein